MDDFSETYREVFTAVLKTNCGGRPATTLRHGASVEAQDSSTL